MNKLRVVQISESDFSVQGHGVHTAFVETQNGLRKYSDWQVSKNNWRAADVRHIHTVGPYSLAQLLFCRGGKVVSAHVVPESFIGSIRGTRYWLWLARLYLRFFYNRASLVIAVSDQTKDTLLKMGVKSRIKVLYNMIDTTRYVVAASERAEIREQLGVSDQFVVIANGQIQPRKRFDSFLEVASKLPEMKFIWVGGIPFGHVADDYKHMKQLIDDAPINVVVTGVVSLAEVRRYFAAGDVFFSPSMQETFGLAIVEAAASGLPLVLRDIHDYNNTFRADAVLTDERGFAAAIRQLATDKKYYQQMRDHAGELAKRFDSRTITRQLLAYYRLVLRKKVI